GPVVLDLGAVGNVETNGTEDRLNALPGLNDRVYPTEAASASRQRDIDCFCSQPTIELGLLQLGTAGVQQSLDLLLELVDACALFALAIGIKRGQALEHGGQRTLLAKKARLCVFQRRCVLRLCELFLCLN